MKIKSGFVLREIADQYMAVAVGERAREVKDMFGMNETAAFLWKLMQNECIEEELVQKLLDEYEIEETDAKQTIQEFCELLHTEGVLENA